MAPRRMAALAAQMSSQRLARRSRGLLLTPRAVAFLAAAASVTAVLTPAPAYSDPGNADIARWQRFRHAFGLREDRGFAEWVGVRASAGARDISIAYGTPLTVEEAAAIDARTARAAAQKTAVRDYFRAQPDGLDGGRYLDNRRDGTLVVLVTGDVERIRNELRVALPHADKVHVVGVRYSESALRRIQDRVAAGDYRARGIEVVSTTLRVKANKVEIRVRSDLNAAAAALTRDFPADAITVEPGEYVDETGTAVKNSPPFRGGQAIGGATIDCSIGFIGHDGASQYFAITAGHCGTAGSSWYQPCCAGVGAGVGVMDYNPLRDGTSLGDTARIPILSTRKSNQITRTMPGGGIYYYGITGWEGWAADDVGDVVCNGGYATNWDCGEITALSYNWYSSAGKRTLYYMRKSDVRIDDGDSGGPFFHVPTAKGIATGKDYNYIEDVSDDEAVYTHIHDALNDLYLMGLYTG